MKWRDHALAESIGLDSANRRRSVTDLDARGVHGLLPDGREVISFASNDYLGLSHHPAVVAAAHDALDRWGAGATSARLIVDSRPVHSELEQELARWKSCESALLFPSGFATNYGVLTALGEPGVLVCSDERNHASIVDGCRASRGYVAVYPHNDLTSLERLLSDSSRTIVVTETVFSMDGDIAPVHDLARLCAHHEALLVLDEAHAVLGPDPDLSHNEALRVGTLSKFLGCSGGFVAGPAPLIDLILNRARSGIFTTALAPADAAASLAALRVLRSSEGGGLRARLRHNIDLLSPGHPAPMIPVIVGSEQGTLDAASILLDEGFLVPAIRPPTVPPGTSRLRVTLSADHDERDVVRLGRALSTLEMHAGV